MKNYLNRGLRQSGRFYRQAIALSNWDISVNASVNDNRFIDPHIKIKM